MLAGDFGGTDYLLGSATHSRTGSKICFFLSGYLMKAGNVTQATVLSVTKCCSQTQLSQNDRVLNQS